MNSEILDTDACWDYIAMAAVGRLAVPGQDGQIDVFPVNFLVHDRAIYFRSAPGTKLRDITAHSSVSFEVDGNGRSRSWSVVVKGSAQRLTSDDEITASGVMVLTPASRGDKFNYVRITPREISGRLLARD